jgi:hypothetical protein
MESYEQDFEMEEEYQSEPDSEMEDGFDLDLLQLGPAARKVDDIAYGLVSVDAPDWYINPAFKSVFAERSSYDSIAASSPLIMAPGLDGVLFAEKPPSVDFFRSLPSALDGDH